ncbi:MAG: DUF11 domain-containing protein, partial [Candidatus Acetothermia bacterium]|nr:DUF11 domain-containing protein [Candidatus Acetothermia bacterium]
MRGTRWQAVAGLLLAWGLVAVGGKVDLSGPTQMGRCEEAWFTIAFTADVVQTASAIVFTVALPNAGFAYVTGSGLITLGDGTPIAAEPAPVGLDLVWDLDLILGVAYELPPGETVTVVFALRTGCGTISGTLGARVDYEEDGVPRYGTDSQPIEILPGALVLYKEPSVVPAAVGDVVTWTLVVENTGLGPIYNVVVTDVLGSGLAYVSSDPAGDNAGQATTWDKSHAPSLEEIAPGQRVEIELQAELVACTGLENRLDARFGCD